MDQDQDTRVFSDINQPTRSWEEVMREYNRRNPDKPQIKSPNSCRAYGHRALQKLRLALAKEA